jgi:hypothetical protein
MSAGIGKVHGQVAEGAVYGYSPLVIRVIDSGNSFTADSVNGTTGVITEGGYSLAVKAIQSLGSIILLSARTDAGSICAIVDGPSFNQGDGAGGNAGATTGFLALRNAIVAATGATLSNVSVTKGTSLANTGAFTLA